MSVGARPVNALGLSISSLPLGEVVAPPRQQHNHQQHRNGTPEDVDGPSTGSEGEEGEEEEEEEEFSDDAAFDVMPTSIHGLCGLTRPRLSSCEEEEEE